MAPFVPINTTPALGILPPDGIDNRLRRTLRAVVPPELERVAGRAGCAATSIAGGDFLA